MQNQLNEQKCKSLLKTPGKYCDGNNLWFVVGKNQRGKWVLRYTAAKNKRREMGLGAYPQIGLRDARKRASEHLNLMSLGRDPIDERENKKNLEAVPTFGLCAEKYISNQRGSWRNQKHAQQWENTIRQYCDPILSKPVNLITQDDILAVLLPIWSIKHETASRLRGRIEKVIGYAVAAKHRAPGNPALYKGSLEFLLPKVKRTIKHRPSLPWKEVPRFWSELRAQKSVSTDALAFLILTAARSDEVRSMTWKEINFETSTWTIPGSRMKLEETHTVPLSLIAIQILRSIEERGPNDYVFSGRKSNKNAISDVNLSNVIERMNKRAQPNQGYYDPDGREACPHGFRSSFRMWAAEMTEHPRDAAEFALAHKLPDAVEAAYQRSTLFAKRIELMNDWSSYVVSKFKDTQ